MKIIATSVDEWVYNAIKEKARDEERTPSFVIRKLLEKALRG